MNISIESIRDKLLLLTKLDKKRATFGVVGGHMYHSTKVGNIELTDLESEYNIELPHDFKVFLTTIGAGAGPGYGIFSLNQMITEFGYWQESLGAGTMNNLFEFTTRDSEEIIARKQNNPNRNDFFKRLTIANGILPINTEGCTYFHYIVLNGEQAGKVWSVEIDEYKTYPAGLFKGKTFDFLEWYSDWLDTSIMKLNNNINQNQPKIQDQVWWKLLLGIK